MVVAGLGLALFGGILQGVRETDTIAYIDQLLGQMLMGIRSELFTDFFEVITGLAGTNGSLLLLSLAFIFLFQSPYRRLPIVLATGAVIALIIVSIVKLLVARPRPELALQLVDETSFSFPSGHTMVAVVLYGLIAYFVSRTVTGFRKVLVFTLWIGFVVAVAASRIYLGIHYPSDTLASASLGGACLSLGVAWLSRHETGLNPAVFNSYARWRLFAAMGFTVLAIIIWRPLFI